MEDEQKNKQDKPKSNTSKQVKSSSNKNSTQGVGEFLSDIKANNRDKQKGGQQNPRNSRSFLPNRKNNLGNNKDGNNFKKKLSQLNSKRLFYQTKSQEIIDGENEINQQQNQVIIHKAMQTKLGQVKNNLQNKGKEKIKDGVEVVAKNIAGKIFLNPYVIGIIIIIIIVIIAILVISQSISAFIQPIYEFREMFTEEGIDNAVIADKDRNKFYEKIQKLTDKYKSCGAELNSKLILATIFYASDYSKTMIEEDEYVEETIDEETGESNIDYELASKRLDNLAKHMVSGSALSSCTLDLEGYKKYLKDEYIEKYLSDELNMGVNDEEIEKQKDEIITDIYTQIEVYNELMGEKEDECSTSGGTSCTYNVDGQSISNLKVRLMQGGSWNQGSCGGEWGQPIDGEELVDFEKYILGVTYAEIGDGSPIEAQKAQSIAVRSYSLTRPKAVNNSKGRKYVQENGQWILQLTNCVSDQAYCDPDAGCSKKVQPGNQWGNIYSGIDNPITYKQPLKADSPLRIAVAETAGKTVNDASGQIKHTSYLQTQQTQWTNVAKNGGDYYQALVKSYGSDIKISEAVCTESTQKYAGGTKGSVSMPLKGSFKQGEYGARNCKLWKATNCIHTGIDFTQVAEGMPIYAIADGVVIKAKSITTSYGNHILLGHDTNGDGTYEYYSLYAHMKEAPIVKVNDKVAGGQQIGGVGATGNVTNVHLHFEIHDANDKPIDPKPLLDEIQKGSSSLGNSSAPATKAPEKGEIYYNQKEYTKTPYCSSRYTIATSGCLPTAFSTVVASLYNDLTTTPETVGKYICENTKYRIEGQGTNNKFLMDATVQSNYKIKTTEIGANLTEVKKTLSENKMIIISIVGNRDYKNESGPNREPPVGKNRFATKNGHYIVLSALDEKGKIKVLDPANTTNNQVYDDNIIQSEILNKKNSGIWSLEPTALLDNNYCKNENTSASGDYANWKQASYAGGGDFSWENTPLGSNSTIRKVGCAATSVAIQIAKSGVQTTVNPFNPKTFVEFMNANSGFQASNLVWSAVTKIAPNFIYEGKLKLSGGLEQKVSQIKKALDDQKYLVLTVKNGGHWVAVDKVENGIVYMFDPASMSTNVNEKYGLAKSSEAAIYSVKK
ncbi:MAG: peptidoglycan DD-metalloendopeptidase family protein [Bacilli bacterium]